MMVSPMTAPLPPDLRSRLAKAIQRARRVAEVGARQALQALAVDLARPFDTMSLAEKGLRNRLRMRGRQVGDRRDRKAGTHAIGHLTHEVAYEHWHRMLFARFLAENGMLRHPEHGVALSLADCRELADEDGVDAWEFAGRCAERMLPEIFRGDDPVLELSLPPETRQELERLLDSLPEAVLTAQDSLGWTYQFWQAERKEEVNKGGAKIGADELPAVTQLFTERYMVLFLLHNTIGAWWAGKVLGGHPDSTEAGVEEDALRQLVRLETGGGYDFSYLRFVRGREEEDGDDARTGAWRPAAGPFVDWPREASDLRVLDPCCGSGHFLVEAFELLVRLRMAEEPVPVQDAIRSVLRDNLFGLEIDPRCTQIAAFNLSLAAWRLAGEPIPGLQLNIACSGLAPNASEAQWRQVATAVEGATGLADAPDLLGGTPTLVSGPTQRAMAVLHRLFGKAPELGSLLDPSSIGQDLFTADFESLAQVLKKAIGRERGVEGRDEHAVAAAGMARAAEILRGPYTLVITNVPFLARGKQARGLRAFAETHHGDAKGDLATMFVSRILGWLDKGGTQAVVSPQNWLFLKTYRKLRERLLKGRTWNLTVRLGTKAFDTPMWDFNVMLNILSAGRPKDDWEMAGVDVSSPWGQRPIKAAEKAELLRGRAEVVMSRQGEQLKNPICTIQMSESPAGLPLLGDYLSVRGGITTGDSLRFRRYHWEINCGSTNWQPQQGTVKSSTPFAGRERYLLSDDGLTHLVQSRGGQGVTVAGREVWDQSGVAISYTGDCSCTLYSGERFENVACVGVAKHAEDLAALWAFCASELFGKAVRANNMTLGVSVRYFEMTRFDYSHWKRVADSEYPDGLPKPYSDDPTQWIFHGDPCRSVVWNKETKRTDHGPPRIDSTVLHVAVARVLGYRWPAELDPGMRLAPEQREVADDCRAFAGFVDADGIVCLAAVRGEPTGADRLREILATAYGDEWSIGTERALLAATGPKPPKSLEDWLRDRFFREHCKLFHNRPFVWHVWDGRKDGFHALVNYHRLAGPDGEGRRTLETLTFAYVNEWIERQRAGIQEGAPGADGRLEAALDLQHELQRILTGERPCDLFVRWRPLHEQAIGWEPEVDDGVRLNIRPFMRAELRKGGRAGAGILRSKPNITWKKDRGTEPEEPRSRLDFPWFWGCPGGGSMATRTDFLAASDAAFDGSRWNDLHYGRETKVTARSLAGTSEGKR